METVEIIKVVLFAIFIGAFIPFLFQLRRSLEGVRRTFGDVAKHLNATLDEVGDATYELKEVATTLNQNKERIVSLVTSANDLAALTKKLEGAVKIAATVGAAVAPSVAAAVQAWRQPVPDEEEAEEMMANATGPNGSRQHKGEGHAKPE